MDSKQIRLIVSLETDTYVIEQKAIDMFDWDDYEEALQKFNELKETYGRR